mmetsp:Transcript_29347/g.57605  ORF Transcript_29347/g.57605 Transcript_29347/m.57605 type:complete len:100 (-) Transcript_29347:925-1224(-)
MVGGMVVDVKDAAIRKALFLHPCPPPKQAFSISPIGLDASCLPPSPPAVFSFIPRETRHHAGSERVREGGGGGHVKQFAGHREQKAHSRTLRTMHAGIC